MTQQENAEWTAKYKKLERERDQLRADLAEAKASNERLRATVNDRERAELSALGEADEYAAELKQLRAANDALTKRLEEATAHIRQLNELFSYSDTMQGYVVPANARTFPVLRNARAFLDSGSSTREAGRWGARQSVPKEALAEIDAKVREGTGPAAPEPAPAMQKPCPHRTTIIACPGIISGDGFCNKCGAKDFGEKPAAPASAQGTGEPARCNECGQSCEIIGEMASAPYATCWRTKSGSVMRCAAEARPRDGATISRAEFEALDKRVAALEEEQLAQRADDSELGRRIAALESCAGESWQIGKPAPFVPHRPASHQCCDEGTTCLICGSAPSICRGHSTGQKETGPCSNCARHTFMPRRWAPSVDPKDDADERCAWPECGQPRSAAVHGEGG